MSETFKNEAGMSAEELKSFSADLSANKDSAKAELRSMDPAQRKILLKAIEDRKEFVDGGAKEELEIAEEMSRKASELSRNKAIGQPQRWGCFIL